MPKLNEALVESLEYLVAMAKVYAMVHEARQKLSEALGRLESELDKTDPDNPGRQGLTEKWIEYRDNVNSAEEQDRLWALKVLDAACKWYKESKK